MVACEIGVNFFVLLGEKKQILSGSGPPALLSFLGTVFPFGKDKICFKLIIFLFRIEFIFTQGSCHEIHFQDNNFFLN